MAPDALAVDSDERRQVVDAGRGVAAVSASRAVIIVAMGMTPEESARAMTSISTFCVETMSSGPPVFGGESVGWVGQVVTAESLSSSSRMFWKYASRRARSAVPTFT